MAHGPCAGRPVGHADAVQLEEANEGDHFAGLIAPVSVEEFFAETWQREPRVFSLAAGGAARAPGRPLSDQGWADCCDMLACAWGAVPVEPPDGCDLLAFHGQKLTHAYDEQGPCAALLDGASCVVNHAEYVWPPFAALCRGLRERLVHVYANSYVTPPGCQAVPPHADDRDVFILQLCGCKHWRVFGTPPVKLPYTNEQVGKSGVPVPEEVLHERPAIECVLQPGDVLYMPRGFVHDARCSEVSSWHATLAVATHDWSWSKVLSAAVATAMDSESSSRWRAAVPLWLSKPACCPEEGEAEAGAVEAEFEQVLDFVRRSVKVGDIRARFRDKIAFHTRLQEESALDFRGAVVDFLSQTGSAACQAWPFLVPCTVDLQTRLYHAGREEQEEDAERLACTAARFKGKGKGKGRGRTGGVVVRREAAGAAAAVLAELERQAGAGGARGGLAVADFRAAAAGAADLCAFDELTMLCLARDCVAKGVLRVAGGSKSPLRLAMGREGVRGGGAGRPVRTGTPGPL